MGVSLHAFGQSDTLGTNDHIQAVSLQGFLCIRLLTIRKQLIVKQVLVLNYPWKINSLVVLWINHEELNVITTVICWRDNLKFQG